MSSHSPNIVLIFVDNHPADMLGCYGNSEVHTPHLDRFAHRGVRFTNAFCINAMCSPSRASVLTGLMPSQHGVHTWIDERFIDQWPDRWNAIAEFDTLPERLCRAGYDTALIGKHHLGIASEPQNDFRQWITMQVGHVKSFYGNEIIENGRRYKHPGHSVDFFTAKAVDYIRDRSAERSQPFFLYLTYPAPYGHWPSIKGAPTNRFADIYRDMPMHSVPREGVSKQMIDWVLVLRDKYPEYDLSYMLQIPNDLPTLRNYYSQASMVDDGVGTVLQALDQTGLSDDTLVIYTSDHGMSLGQHGFWGHGEDTWPSNTHREANHIPLIVRPPGSQPAERVVPSLVGTPDIFASILDYAGLELPPKTESPSRSMRPLIEKHNADWDDVCFMEQEETRSIRTGKWLFMRRFAPSPYNFQNELYDLENDPDERTNLAGDPDKQIVVEELSDRIDAFFSVYANPKWDLWKGGSVKSNSTRPFLWQEVWGNDWKPDHSAENC